MNNEKTAPAVSEQEWVKRLEQKTKFQSIVIWLLILNCFLLHIRIVNINDRVTDVISNTGGIIENIGFIEDIIESHTDVLEKLVLLLVEDK